MSGSGTHLAEQRERPVGRVDVAGCRRRSRTRACRGTRTGSTAGRRVLLERRARRRARSRRARWHPARRTSCRRAPPRGRTATVSSARTSAAHAVVSVNGAPRRGGARARRAAGSSSRPWRGSRAVGRRSGTPRRRRRSISSTMRAASAVPVVRAARARGTPRGSRGASSARASAARPSRRRPVANCRRGGAASRSSSGVVTTGSPAARYW